MTTWSAKDLADAWAIANRLLSGVGIGPNHSKNGDVAIHLRRRLSDSEKRLLTEEWLKIPAIDEG